MKITNRPRISFKLLQLQWEHAARFIWMKVAGIPDAVNKNIILSLMGSGRFVALGNI